DLTEEAKNIRYRKGEGVTGSVFEKNKFLAIQDISKDKKFLNKLGREIPKEKLSFFAVPLRLDDEVIGVFSMEAPYKGQSAYEDHSFLAQLLASMFSQAIRIQRMLDKQSQEIRFENLSLKRQLQERYSFGNIVGTSPKMEDLFAKIKMAADTSSSVLLIGESGTGKELIATALHQNSIRKEKPLVKINCAAIPSELLESELFGHTKGAFTDATEDRKGKFLLAHGGTIFLDEIGEMDYRLQSKLLRVLQEKEFSPLGSNKVYRVDVRIIAATNADLERLVKQKRFRADLYYRLNVVRIEVPPLRERKEDLPILAQHLIGKITKVNGKKTRGILPDALKKLESYDFPGNVRELENILERAIVLSDKLYLEADDIDLPERTEIPSEPKPVKEKVESVTNMEDISLDKAITYVIKELLAQYEPGEKYWKTLARLEKEIITQVLKRNTLKQLGTAKELGVNRLTLRKKIEEYHIMEEIMRID
ncbi:MAG: AAA family ATPase, partial [Candidatus Hydrogenedentota bacterium]